MFTYRVRLIVVFSSHKNVLKLTFFREFLSFLIFEFLPSLELIYVRSLQIYIGLRVNHL